MSGSDASTRLRQELHTLSAAQMLSLGRPPQHAFTPVLRKAAALPAAHVTGAQDGNLMSRSCFAPVAAFPSPVSDTCRERCRLTVNRPKLPLTLLKRRGQWAALHASIAWKIYYDKQFKNGNGLCAELTRECPSGAGEDSPQPSCSHPKPASHFPDGTKVRLAACRTSAGHPSDGDAPSPASCHEHRTTHRPEEADGQGRRRDRKRPLEHDSFGRAKREKRETVDGRFDCSETRRTDPSVFSRIAAHPPPRSSPGRHGNTGRLRLLYPSGSPAPGGALSYPEPDVSPYPTTSWQLLWNVHKGEDLLSRRAVTETQLHEAPRQMEAFTGFFAPPLYFSPASGVQGSYLRDEALLRSRQEGAQPRRCRSHLPQPGVLTSSC